MNAAPQPPGTLPTRGWVAPAEMSAPLRVFAVQYRINIEHAEHADSFAAAMRALMVEHVQPYRVAGQPTLVVFPEAIGLLALAFGERGERFRDRVRTGGVPFSEHPVALLDALTQLAGEYAPQLAAYTERFGALDPRSALFTAACDTIVCGFANTFSELAREFGVFVVAGGYLPDVHESSEPALIERFGDPHAPASTVTLASAPEVYNQTFLWAPHSVQPSDVPGWRRNLLAHNKKVPLTEMEQTLLGIVAGPSHGEAGQEHAGPTRVAGVPVGFATSLPAFAYGYPFGERPERFDPLADLNVTYAAGQDALGVRLMIQSDANAGPWAWPVASGAWQPLEWMSSVWRAVADPTVEFAMNVTPMMTGALLDVMFDGQSSITRRGAAAPPQAFVGCAEQHPSDPAEYAVYAGTKPEFLALAPWAPWAPATEDREKLMQHTAALMPGSGHAHEGHFVQTVIFADVVGVS